MLFYFFCFLHCNSHNTLTYTTVTAIHIPDGYNRNVKDVKDLALVELQCDMDIPNATVIVSFPSAAVNEHFLDHNADFAMCTVNGRAYAFGGMGNGLQKNQKI